MKQPDLAHFLATAKAIRLTPSEQRNMSYAVMNHCADAPVVQATVVPLSVWLGSNLFGRLRPFAV